VIKSNRIRQVGHVECMGEKNLKGRDHTEDLGVDGKSIRMVPKEISGKA
jgi:hypothetical protein